VNAKSMRNGRLQIAQDTLHCKPMSVPGVLHKFGEFVDHKCNISRRVRDKYCKESTVLGTKLCP
jgi:hypothetical protein